MRRLPSPVLYNQRLVIVESCRDHEFLVVPHSSQCGLWEIATDSRIEHLIERLQRFLDEVSVADEPGEGADSACS